MHHGKETFRHVAPIGSGEHKAWGRHEKKPWHYQVTAAIPHIDTLESLQMCIELLRRQTIRPYIIVVDTGSPPAVQRELEQMRAEDLEVHYVNAHAYFHSSEPVTVAMDLAHALCRTPHLFHTHADCFLRRQDFLEFMVRITNANTPVAGYRMSNRDWLIEKGVEPNWRWMVGHTATMLFMPSILRSGASWNLHRCRDEYGYSLENLGGWIDTETGFNHGLREAGIVPLFIGDDQNGVREIDGNRDHVRSYCGGKVYGSANYNVPAAEWMVDALAQAAARISAWDCQSSANAVAANPTNPPK